MSQWTHVAGLIRLDSIGAQIIKAGVIDKDHYIVMAAREALGHTWKYDAPSDLHACTVPEGSEGSLQYVVERNEGEYEDSHALSWGFVAIYGDLRDYDSADPIVEWFKSALEKLRNPASEVPVEQMNPFDKAMHMLRTFAIRDAVLSIDVEGLPRTVLSWNDQQQVMTQLQVG